MSNRSLSVLLIEDSQDDAFLLLRELRRAGYTVTSERVDTPPLMQMAFESQQWDIVICDYVMPHFSAPDALALLKQSGFDLPFIVVSGAVGEEIVVSLMRAGAHDYLMKDNLVRLVPAIEREMQEAINRREHRRAQELSYRLGRIVDRTSNEIYIFQAETLRFVQVNRGAIHNLGYPVEKIMSMTPLDLQPEMTAERFHGLLKPLYGRSRERIRFETIQRRQDGSTYPIEISLTLSDVENPPVFVAIGLDITERRKAQQALYFMAEASTLLAATLDSETTFKSIAQLAIPFLADLCLVDIVDEPGGIRRVASAHTSDQDEQQLTQWKDNLLALEASNPAMMVIRGLAPYEIGDTRNLIPERFAQDVGPDQNPQNPPDNQPRQYLVVPLILRERILGAISLFCTTTNRVYDESYLAIAQELARRAAVAIDNARLYQEAQQALLLRDQFLSIAAHELKTPITALLGNTQLIKRRVTRGEGTTLGERELRMLNVVEQQAQRLGRMVEALLDISRIRSGTLTIEHDVLDIGDLAERIVDEIQPTLDDHSLEVTRSKDMSLIVSGDALRLEQVFQNLIQNAIKYSPHGGTIKLYIGREDMQARIAVIDQGIGIPPRAIPGLFRQFFRAENAWKQQITGLGLGLFIVREIVALHGGRLEVQSTEGKGSTFSVFLPLLPQRSFLSRPDTAPLSSKDAEADRPAAQSSFTAFSGDPPQASSLRTA